MAEHHNPQLAVLFRPISGFRQEYMWPLGVASQLWQSRGYYSDPVHGRPNGVGSWPQGVLQACDDLHSPSLANDHLR